VTDMTAKEAQAAFVEFQKSVGGRAWIAVGMNTHDCDKPLYCSLYASGVTGSKTCEGRGVTWDEVLADLLATWNDTQDRHRKTRTRKMALEIIRITAERGACTDADLRADLFSAEEVAQLGSEAVYDANKIASNGPFELVRLAGANAA